MLHGLSFEGDKTLGIVDRRVDGVFDTSSFLGFFGVVPAVERPDKVAGDAAEAFELAFVEVFGVGFEVFLGGLGAGFVGDEVGARFN